ncbi:MAG: hypothetical protein U0270_20355 [Labilithrix sp.]
MTLVRLATVEEGRTILGAEDDFTRALGGFDRSFRLRTTEPVSDAELRRFLGEQATEFTPDEAAAWEPAIEAVARGARGLGPMLPAEVLVVKTTGREERDHAYTRANAIILPAARVASFRGDRAIYLLAHELFHVATRSSPALRDATYALLGFTAIAPIAPPIELDARRMTNPDAHRLGHYLRLGDHAVVPLLTCVAPLAEVIGRASVFDAATVSLLAIDPVAGAALRDARGAPVVIEAKTTDWAKRIGRNTRYTIHPEEVLADNHALLVRRRLGSGANVADPAFLAAFEEAIASQRRAAPGG